jgi:DNA-binding NarL/FixJ family response regulator
MSTAISGEENKDGDPCHILPAQPGRLSLVPRRGKPIMVLIEPRPLMRECLSRFLRAHARNVRIVAVSKPAELVASGAYFGGMDLILVNLGGAEATDEAIGTTVALLRRALPDTPTVVLSDCEAADRIVKALRCGVRGYIPTSMPLAAVVEALRFVRAGGTFVPASAVVQPAGSERPAADERSSGSVGATGTDGFTARELEVLALLRRGEPNKIIAHELNIQEGTLKVHIRNIRLKLKVTTRTQIALLAHQLFEKQDSADSDDPQLSSRAGDARHRGRRREAARRQR